MALRIRVSAQSPGSLLVRNSENACVGGLPLGLSLSKSTREEEIDDFSC